MFLFLADKIEGNSAVISAEEVQHAVKVLRMKTGDEILVTSLDGVMHKAAIDFISKDSISANIVESFPDWGKRNYSLRVCLAPTKNIDRYEWFLEKSVEIGIDRITPICTDHSERKIVKMDRSKKILRSAVKQSMKSSMPVLDEMIDIDDLLNENFDKGESLFIAHCDENEFRSSIKELMKKGGNYTILIGPEGDFSEREVKLARDKGFIPVTFGESRLRTETAGVWAVALASIIN